MNVNLISKISCIVVCLVSILITSQQPDAQTWGIVLYACFLNIPAMFVIFPNMLMPPSSESGKKDLAENDSKTATNSIPSPAIYAWLVIAVLLIVNHLVKQ